jgi:phosphoglucosamine mutase
VKDAAGRYIEFCKSTVPTAFNLKGMKVVVDCAHGATYHIAPSVFDELDADVIAIGDEPNGLNINDQCGSTKPQALQQAVIQHQADVGIALDGDGDRVIMVDHTGELVDGDELLFIIAQSRLGKANASNTVVGTLMSNLGLELALKDLGLGFERAQVGDRYVLEKLLDGGWLLGGESSGHIICLDRTTTGDGIIAALQVLYAMRQSGRSLQELKSGMRKFPQVMENVRVTQRIDLSTCVPIQQALRQAEAELGAAGRILLRPSGTEPLIRVMVEGQDAGQVSELTRRLVGVVSEIVSG